MLPPYSQIAFIFFASVMLAWGGYGFYKLYRRVLRGRADVETRFDHLPQRLAAALAATLSQSRTFKRRTVVSLFHSFIFYGFTFYLLVNFVDGLEGFFPIRITNPAYLFLADVLSFLVLFGVIALVIRRFALPSRRDFRFNARTLLHPAVRRDRITRDSVIVSAFILFHVGSRAIGSAASLSLEGPNQYEPFATLLSHAIPSAHAEAIRVFGFWGALGSVLAFLAYFPYTKHIHIFMAPVKYAIARRPKSGVIPPLDVNTEDATTLGAKNLEDLAWPRLVDAYACIQCNRCQDVCPASATGKSLSPAALEINKRMELNALAGTSFDAGTPSPQPLLAFALSPDAAWACTTCGACIDVCPVGDEQMLDILDIRRHQVMVEADFPAQLQSAFRGMERAQNPWGINRAKRLDWAEGLRVPTTETNPTPEVLYWVGCAASYDPSAQKTARAFVQLLDHAGVDFAVLGKRECCTGDSARRAGNEYLYRQLADENVSTLNTLAPKLIVASCPHCMNSIGNEYKQIGGDYKVVHHTEYLETLVASGKLSATPTSTPITYHDPCYLGRHNGVYEAPRNLLNILSNDFVELPRNRENAFCCGAGGAQFWKEEEAGDERISDNRFREAQATLAIKSGAQATLAVGCPFCKSMLSSTPLKGADENIAIKDIAELLLEAVLQGKSTQPAPAHQTSAEVFPILVSAPSEAVQEPAVQVLHQPDPSSTLPPNEPPPATLAQPVRKKWAPALQVVTANQPQPQLSEEPSLNSPAPSFEPSPVPPPERKKWQPKPTQTAPETPHLAAEVPQTGEPAQSSPYDAPPRKKWSPAKSPKPDPPA